jgi:hypothetical protein
MITVSFGDYIVFIDESGDHGLDTIDPEFPVFVLVFVIVEKRTYVGQIVPAIKALKFDFWGHDAVILHSHEIRKPRGDFAFLLDRSRREAFTAALNSLMGEMPMTVVAAAIEKNRLTERYRHPHNPYYLALGMGMERVARFLIGECGQEGKITHLIAESRGQREDSDLELEFRRIMDGEGRLNYGIMGAQFDLRVVSKKVNAEGLQLADLVAHPIARHVLKPEQANRAFDIVRGALYGAPDEIYGMGLKIFP